MNRQSIAAYLLAIAVSATVFTACKKNDHVPGNGNQASSYSSYVLDTWMTMQIRLMRNATGIPNQALGRHFAYSGIAALESLAPGLNGNERWSDRWNGLTGLPAWHPSTKYYFPANVNAAMAAINKAMFPNASAADKAAIDSLELAFINNFASSISNEMLVRSSNFGKAVAAAVFNWADADGHKFANGAYTPPSGPGMWVPTPPANAPASTPYWGKNRTIISGSIANTRPAPPVAYSAEVGSPFYNMVKEVYDASQNLTNEQKAMATFWRDVPGVTSPGHWLSIVQQAIRLKNARLDKAALAYALTGTAINDALIGCWEAKFHYNLVRPITYIRSVMEQGSWTSHLGTPPHPEYPSAHSALSSAAAEALVKIFGDSGAFTDHTYDYLGFEPRVYFSFTGIANEAGQSRLYAGIHYKPSIEAGLQQGKKVVENIFSKGK